MGSQRIVDACDVHDRLCYSRRTPWICRVQLCQPRHAESFLIDPWATDLLRNPGTSFDEGVVSMTTDRLNDQSQPREARGINPVVYQYNRPVLFYVLVTAIPWAWWILTADLSDLRNQSQTSTEDVHVR